MKQVIGGITKPKGFEAAAVAAEIKYKNRTDMALVYSQSPCEVAGTFTKNIVKAAPVKWDQKVVADGVKSQVVVVNSGIANACTGKQGEEYCKQTAEAVAKALNVNEAGVLIGSTGVIGMQLPIERIVAGIECLAGAKSATIEAGTAAAQAIMTTDTCKKEIAYEVEIEGVTVTVGGMAKGSGMIHPDMCTMLSFVTTDANISREALKQSMSDDVEDTYNMISVDGDTSTNDTALIMANGIAGNPIIEVGTENYQKFCQALHEVNEYLAKQMAGDGEGATALFEVQVVGAATKEQAKVISKSVITSNLTKTAIAGHDANWGRILCAMGYSGATFDPEKVDLKFQSSAGSIEIIRDGVAVDYSEDVATEILSKEHVIAIADLKLGAESATAWGCDLTHGYIDINADYRS